MYNMSEGLPNFVFFELDMSNDESQRRQSRVETNIKKRQTKTTPPHTLIAQPPCPRRPRRIAYGLKKKKADEEAIHMVSRTTDNLR
jgi:hypothetical protein